ncbi:DNA polymerase III subunit gamma and tau [Micrococcus porci]|uniref:DNA polymerase III subunit gamma and tau n=1 Tax=Micrococcus porci TaxID=2856555 RepID=UPI001CC941AA|nr:DNA polymerase III subunit gamma and tau [Micrococcus porci]UBH24729.1 DNA polymerase III subunit gamma and tau [Micrococcus porci]
MSTALYRRYRPDRFEDVIGQDHVTVPLRTALAKDRVNHAYLFSGPRGCGKTTSARILARCLNCAQGPTPTPCGECDSCRDLATGGPGSLDVLEIDAASHGGVEDARGLRERATFAPVRDRYKILIIDEAHMVTAAGFNALLKIVEEPPEHLKFIFATTEPEKVIGTIRSRTHHYPFRLVPPEPLIAYLERLCQEEGVRVEPGVLPLVVRAGTGSVRDTLSVLDQLIGGAQQGQVSYDLAVSLLGFTPEALLDDVVDAIAADDTPTVFRVADRVVQSGQDPRRFVEDLLERFRDLVIARALPDEASSILHGMPEDQVRRLAAQASQLSRAELSRLADVTNLALTDMVGATSPRLHLELLMARLMLPATDDTHRGLAARLEALERRVAGGAAFSPDDDASSGAEGPAAGGAGQGGAALSGAALARAAARRAEPEQAREQEPGAGSDKRAAEPATPKPATPEPVAAAPAPERPVERPAEAPAPSSSAPAAPAAPTAHTPSQVEKVRRAWPDILAALESDSRLMWMLVKDNATVAGYDGELLTVAFPQEGPRRTLQSRNGEQVLGEAVHRVLGIRPRLDLILGGDTPRGEERPKAEGRPAAAVSEAPAAPSTSAPPPAPQGQPTQAQPPRAQPSPEDGRRPAASAPRPQDVAVATSWDQAPAPSAAPWQPAPSRPAAASPAPQTGPAAPSTPDPRQDAHPGTRPGPADTTPPAAPPSDGWGHVDEEPPAWDDAPPPPEDPWDSLPEFDPDADMEDSPGPEGWTPGAGDDAVHGSAGSAPTSAPEAWGGAVPTPQDWGAPRPQDPVESPAPQGPEAGTQGTAPDAAAQGAPSPAAPAEAVPEDPETARRAYDPGPLVREEELTIPVFAKPEAQLRAEFAARFGGTRPAGFDSTAASDAAAPDAQGPGAAARAAAHGEPVRGGQDAAEPAADREAEPEEDPQAAASAPEHPVRPSPARPTADDTPDPGVPQEDHAEDAAPPSATAPDDRGSGHPDSHYPALMERLRASGPLEPPVNARPAGQGGAREEQVPAPVDAAPSPGRPSAASLGRPTGDPQAAIAPPAEDPRASGARAAAIQAAREAARGAGPRPADGAPGGPATASGPSVDWQDEVASDDDVALEDSGLVGRPVVERLLGARLLEERPLEPGL